MTSKLSRDRLQEIAEDGFLKHGESKALARMALAAMDSEPVEMPLDYLQGHKDGLEWAAKLAEANHPETGDWLYDDPIELAKAIRKGPDIPPSQPVLDTEPVAYTDERNLGYIDRGRETAYLWGNQNSEASDVALYRHAQPAPVVPEDFDFNRFNDVVWLECVASNPHMHSPTTSAIARVALELNKRSATMEAEPDRNPVLAYADSYRDMAKQGVDSVPIWSVITDLERNIAPLYRHAQPAPVVPDEMTIRDACKFVQDMRLFDDVSVIVMRTWNACRAAMLQELKKSAGTEAICRSDENVQVLNTIKATPALGSLPKTDEVQNTNSPVIPDGYVMVPVEPNGDMLAAAQDAYGETDGDIASTLRAAMLAAAQQEGK